MLSMSHLRMGQLWTGHARAALSSNTRGSKGQCLLYTGVVGRFVLSVSMVVFSDWTHANTCRDTDR